MRTVSLAVMLFELTGAQIYIVPFMFAATISKLFVPKFVF
jgi:H+/Cl- antiporter ClcA